jgi:Bacterial Ig domain/Cadherin-like domain/CARDB/FG-GAP-like repeat/SdrD B-like domain
MSFTSWLRGLNRGSVSTLKKSRPCAPRTRGGRCRPSVELLEDRVVPTAGVDFSPAQTFAVGSAPRSVAVGYFNADGNLDLAVANATGSVGVLLGNGDGTFQVQQTFAVVSGPFWLAVADFNGDGKPDLATANADDSVSVLLGNGDGTFQSEQTFAVGSRPFSVAAGDFNGDGKPDLVTPNLFGNNVSVLLGNGDGTFQTQQTFAVGANPLSVAVGDFNGDGEPDLAVANDSGASVSVLQGNGDGTFQTQQTFAVGVAPYSVAVGYFNADGHLDLAVANATGSMSVLLGNGDGTFQTQQTFATVNAQYSVVVADFNADGKPDLATANGGDSTSVLLGIGDGTFQSEQNFALGSHPFSVAAGDFNGDGKLDLVAANYFGDSVSVLLNTTQLNQPPTAAADQYTMAEDGVLTANVLANDTDADGDALTLTAVTQGANGSVVSNADGTIAYTPAPNFHGSDAFTYTVSDGQRGTATAAVTVDVASVPDPVRFVADSQTFTVERGTIQQVLVSIVNTDTDPREVTGLLTVDPLADILVYFDTDVSALTIAPGETVQVMLTIDATNAVNTQVDVQGILTSTGEPAQAETLLSVVVVEPGAPARPDLTVSLAGGFTPANPSPGTSVMIQATVGNAGTAASDASEVSILVFDTASNANIEIGRVAMPALAPGGSATVSFTWDTANAAKAFSATEGVVLITAQVDPDNLVAELKERNNAASQLLTIGSVPVVQGFVSVQGSIGLVCGPALPVSGIAQYDLQTAHTVLHFPVQGGMVTVEVLDAATGALLQRVTGFHTDVDGRYSLPITRPDVDVLVRVTVSDTGFAGTQVLQLPLALLPSTECEPPEPPPPPETPPGDIYVYSEDIHFAPSLNPAAGGMTTILASIHLTGSVPVYNVPVHVNAIYPEGGSLHVVEIGSSVVSFPNGDHGPALISLDWINTGASPYIIEIVTEPGYAQYTGNDAATREITAGSPVATAAITVDGALSTACGGYVSANLSATYIISSGAQTFSFPVQGGFVRLSRLNADTGADIDEADNHTDVSGAFYVRRDSLGEVNTILRLDVTDTTLTYEREVLTPACVPAPPGSPGVPAPYAPGNSQDIYLFSEDIAFSDANPDLDQTITIFAMIHYYGAVPALDVPVTINDIFPVGDMLVTAEIGHTTVSFPEGGADGPVFVIINWTNHLEWAHIIQVATDPAFAQYTGNDQATRLMFVGAFTVPVSNTPPLAQGDTYATDEDTPLVIAAAGVLANDIDAELDALTATVVTVPVNGTLTLNADGSFTYTPNANFNGSDSFTYKGNDGALDSDVVMVTLTVNAVNDVPVADNLALITDEDKAVKGSVTATDVEGDPLTFTLVNGPDHGNLSFNDKGAFTYTPNANYNGSDRFTYSANDDDDSNVATVSITVKPVNDAPVAADDGPYLVVKGSQLIVSATNGVLHNDTDLENNTLTVILVSGPAHANSFALNPDGSFSYASRGADTTSDSFTYMVSDGDATSNVATVAITVTRLSALTGKVFDDKEGDGFFVGDSGLGGITLYLDANHNGRLDDGETTAITNGQGHYRFAKLAPGSYEIREVLPDGFILTAPKAGSYYVSLASGQTVANNDFGNFKLGKVSGVVFNDRNGDGVPSSSNGHSGDGGLANRSIFLDANGNGVRDEGEMETQSNSNGIFQFTDVMPGNYQLREIMPAGWVMTTPTDEFYPLHVTSGAQITRGFGNFELASLGGRVFVDNNRNGLQNGNDQPLPGRIIFLDSNENGVLDAGEVSNVTDHQGNYRFDHIVGPGPQHVREVLPAGWVSTRPVTGGFAISLQSGADVDVEFSGIHQGSVVSTWFGNFYVGAISGKVQQLSQPQAGVTVFIDLNENGVLDPDESSTRTDANGEYALTRPTQNPLHPGNGHGFDIQIREIPPLGFVNGSFHEFYSITIEPSYLVEDFPDRNFFNDPVSSATFPYSDDFDRGNTSKLSRSWVEIAGDLAIRSQQLVAVGNAAQPSIAVFNGAVAADVHVQAKVYISDDIQTTGLVARDDPNSQSMYVAVLIKNGSTAMHAQIWTIVAGVKTVLASIVVPGPSAGATQLLGFDVVGSTLSLTIGDMQILNVVDSSIQQPGRVGVYVSGSGILDDFQADSV